MIHNWLTGEAKTTIEQFCLYIKDSVDIILNILLNLSTIIYAVGPKIGMLIGTTLLFGFLVIWLIKGKLEEVGNNIQKTKNNLFVLMDSFVDKLTSLPLSSRRSLYKELNTSLNNYFIEENRNSFLESIVPLIITICAIFGLAYSLAGNSELSISIVSVLVVALPRILQIFQYLYLIIGYIQQFVSLRNKNKNLITFCTKILSIDPRQVINFECICIKRGNSIISYNELISSIHQMSFGIYTVFGLNGAGKSILLKWIKAEFPESILITPDNNRNLGQQNLSSGQNLKQLIAKTLMEYNNQIILLDEWNANFDLNMEQEIANKISLAASQNIIVEVRHK